jgi:LPS sulfotransferase NodH
VAEGLLGIAFASGEGNVTSPVPSAPKSPRGIRYAFIVSRPRSGSTALGRTLGLVEGVNYCGEVFHHARGPHDDENYDRYLVAPEYNYFTFRQRMFSSFPDLAYPSRKNQQALWTHFLTAVESRDPGKLHVLDVKYNSVHHLDPLYHSPFDSPLLLQLLKAQQIPIIHIVRHNLVAQAISLLIAQRTGRWHKLRAWQPAEPPSPIAIEPRVLLDTIERAGRELKHFEAVLRHHPRLLPLTYETLYNAKGDLDPDEAKRINDFLGLDGGILWSHTPPTERLQSSPFSAVSNLKELEVFLSNTRYVEMFRDIRQLM